MGSLAIAAAFAAVCLVLTPQPTHGATITASCDDIMTLYFDNVQQTNKANYKSWPNGDTHTIPSGTKIIGIKCVDGGGYGGIIASISDGRYTDTWSWKCSKTYNSNWLDLYFDDSSWVTPHSFGTNTNNVWNHAGVSGINNKAKWIWTPGHTNNDPTDSTVYCRTSYLYRTMGAGCDDKTRWFFDGAEASLPNGNVHSAADKLLVPVIIDVMAFSCQNTGGAGYLAVSNSDGRHTAANSNWKCTNTGYSNWHTKNYNDAGWSTPKSFGTISSFSWGASAFTNYGLSGSAAAIWTGGTIGSPTGTMLYCRTKMRIHGNWGNWGSYGTCVCPVNTWTGTQTRSRSCNNPARAYYGRDCVGSSTSSQACNCPRNGGWTAWSAWATCTCAINTYTGSQSSTRSCTNPTPLYGGAQCTGSTSKSQTCNCPRDGGLSAWTSWDTCSCPPGTYDGSQGRTRQCNNPTPLYGGKDCTGALSGTQACNCPRDGNWASWGSWATCSCPPNTYNGTQEKTRTCSNPAPAYGGAQCPGSATASQDCNCPRDGGLSVWTSWDTCSCPPGTYDGNQGRTRQCNNPTPLYGGADCTGALSGTQACNCPRDGNWASWGSWSTCSCPPNIYDGTQEKTRTCSNPAPAYGGAQCPGNGTASQDCNCPRNGGLSAWTSWSTCACPVGTYDGSQDRSRECNNPTPKYGGLDCVGALDANQTCNCPRDGNWGSWNVPNCTCPNGEYFSTREKTRVCDNPTPAYGGNYCPGDAALNETCGCLRDGGFGEWGNWADCSCSDSTSGNQARTRACDNPSPLNGGEQCSGDTEETQTCTCASISDTGAQEGEGNSDSDNTATSAGAATGGIFGAAAVAACVAYLIKKRRSQGQKKLEEDDPENGDPCEANGNGSGPCNTGMPDISA